MAMRKKTDDEKAARMEAEKVVDRFLDVFLSGDDDISRESRSIIGALVDFKGECRDHLALAVSVSLPAKWTE